MSKTYKTYFGKRFYQDKKGYWVNGMPIHAHRWVWINHNGVIPPKMDIHHIDGDKSNNEIDNLQMLSRSDHLKLHWEEGLFDVEQRRIQLTEARKWLKTPQGRKKQSIKAKEGWKTRKPLTKKCLDCEKDFETYQRWAKFCGEACYMRNRRRMKIGFIQKNCWICNTPFSREKGSRVRTCSKSCGGKLGILTKNRT